MLKPAVISASGLTKFFGTVLALDNFDLEVQPGIFGLIGPNGSGKTTLVRLLLDLIKPQLGSGRILGFDIQEDSLSLRRRIGILHEKVSFPKSMTVFRYLETVRKIYESDASSNDMLSKVGLRNVADRKIGNLSAGMSQRLGIAQALIGQPELVILDEPTSNLDVV
ncbi:MAG: ABC transporter ATP-binding protein, partial [Candidatus Thorarchaeota archaeon]